MDIFLWIYAFGILVTSGNSRILHSSTENEIKESPDEMRPKIISGREAEEGEFPFVIALHHRGRFICTSFLVTPNIVMTAAHCVKDENGVKSAKDFHGIIGNVKRKGPDTRIEFSEVVPHPEYGNGGGMEGDIAFFRTSKPVELSDGIQTICLPESGRTFDGETGTAVGWGATSNIPGEAPESLMTTELTIVPRGTCSFFFIWSGISITDRHVCTNSPRATGVCYGDSGGPLVYRDKDTNKTMAIGVTSFGTLLGCGRPYIPSVYTATSGYTDWMKESVGEDSSMCFV